MVDQVPIGPTGPILACPTRSAERRATSSFARSSVDLAAPGTPILRGADRKRALAGTSVTGGRLNAARALRQAAKAP